MSTSNSVPFTFMRAFNICNQWKMHIFDPIARGDTAETANGCQVMRYYHLKKDLNRNEHLNLNLEQNTSLTAA